MSPEQIRGETIGFPSDAYQLGLVLYRTLSGRHPFEQTSTMEVIFKQLNQRPELSATQWSGLPRFLRFGLEKALEKSPARRFSDAGAMATFFKAGKMSWLGGLLSAVNRRPVKWGLACLALAALGFLAYQETFGSRFVHALRNDGSRLEARNRFGVRLWQKDFFPFAVYYAYPTRSSVPEVLGTASQSADLRLRLGDRKVILVILTPGSAPVFPAGASIASPILFSRRVILGEGGETLRQEPFLQDYEFDTYDYIKVVKPHMVRLLPGMPGREAEALATVQQYQSMYPSAMVYMRGIKKYIFTHPGTFEVTPLPSAGTRSPFMLFGINNLFAHMSFLAEIGFNTAGDDDQVIKGVPNFFADERNNIPYEDKLYILPARAKMIKNRWRENGQAVFSEDIRGDVMEVDGDGRIVLHTKNGDLSYQDPPDVLRRVYTMVNSGFQEKLKKHNLEGALAMIGQAASFPLQNPYLHSALLYMQGDLEIGLGRYAAGEKSLRRALELYPGINDACERLCEMDVLKGDPQAALERVVGTYADSTEFWGFGSFGVQLFKGYVFLHMGMFIKAEEEFARIRTGLPDIGQYCQGMSDLFQGRYAASLAAARDLEKWPLGAADLRELRLLLGRALLLADTDFARAKFLFDDIFRNSLEFGHLAELSRWYLLAREGRAAEARQNASEAFTHLQARARGDFMTRLWLFYDAYVFGRTMELAGDRAEAARGYRACIEANPHAELAARSRQSLERLQRRR
jgi:tetratricopeptide (TPR) repeat protein